MVDDHTPEIRFDTDLEGILTYAVIGTRYCDRWIFVRHKLRGLEIPGSYRRGELPRAARREFARETSRF